MLDRQYLEDFLARLWTLCPRALPAIMREALALDLAETALIASQIDSPDRLEHFFAQVCHETDGLHVIEENLNYSAEGLARTWPSKYSNPDLARLHARRPMDIASYVYATVNGNRVPGDGWKYRGRGLIQLTGRSNYTEIGGLISLPLDLQPELVLDPDHMLIIAGTWWQHAGCNAYADLDDIEGVTRRVNGKRMLGLDKRMLWLRDLRGL